MITPMIFRPNGPMVHLSERLARWADTTDYVLTLPQGVALVWENGRTFGAAIGQRRK
jgi:hypothetical protein